MSRSICPSLNLALVARISLLVHCDKHALCACGGRFVGHGRNMPWYLLTSCLLSYLPSLPAAYCYGFAAWTGLACASVVLYLVTVT